ncbi:hypothetical protein V8E36_005211 [Tilletia maclaganii]
MLDPFTDQVQESKLRFDSPRYSSELDEELANIVIATTTSNLVDIFLSNYLRAGLRKGSFFFGAIMLQRSNVLLSGVRYSPLRAVTDFLSRRRQGWTPQPASHHAFVAMDIQPWPTPKASTRDDAGIKSARRQPQATVFHGQKLMN